MKQSTRILALLLSLVLVLALAACGGDTGSQTTSAGSEAVSVPEAPVQEAPPAEEPSVQEAASVQEASLAEEPDIVIEYPLFDELQTYTIWLGTAPDLTEVVYNMDEFVIFRELQKITNVGWEAKMVSFMAEAEQFQLMLAGGEYTDVVVKAVDNYNGTVDQAIEEEFLIDLAPLIPENMPNLTNWFEKYPELPRQLKSDNGAIGAFPKLYAAPSDISSGGMIRADWLEDLGLENPKTFDGLYDTLLAFRDEKGATAPLAIAVSTGVQSELISGYNISAGFYQVDGEVRYGAVQPEFKEYLTMMNRWYSEGLIDDLFLTNQYESLVDTSPVLNGTCGVWFGTAAQSIPNMISSAADPNMRITGLTTVTKDGEQAHIGEAGSLFDSHMWSITAQCQDPETICRYIDYVYSEDGTLLANYGVEGETFTYVDGTPKLTDLVLNNPDYSYGAAMNIFVCDRMTPAPFVIDEDRVRADYIPDQLDAIDIWNNSNDGLYNMPKTGVNLSVDESEQYYALYSDIDTYLDENIVKFVVGDQSLDQFDQFAETLKTMGIDQCIEIYQAAYDRYLGT